MLWLHYKFKKKKRKHFGLHWFCPSGGRGRLRTDAEFIWSHILRNEITRDTYLLGTLSSFFGNFIEHISYLNSRCFELAIRGGRDPAGLHQSNHMLPWFCQINLYMYNLRLLELQVKLWVQPSMLFTGTRASGAIRYYLWYHKYLVCSRMQTHQHSAGLQSA